MRILLSGLWLVLSVAVALAGILLAVVAPNGFPGVLLALLGAFSLGAWAERGDL
jgi:hypothetical protein